jgi:hypothetical protein
LILPTCNTEAKNLHLAEIAEMVAPGAHAVLMVDQAGWLAPIDAPRRATQHNHHGSAAEMPRAQSGRERVAVHARQLALQPRLQIPMTIFDHCCEAWNKLVDQPWHIMSIGFRQWAHEF